MKTAKLEGELVVAGTDADGQDRLLVLVDRDQMAQFKPLPLYVRARITFEWDREVIGNEPPGGDQSVRIDERLLGRIGVREWGLPSLCVPGKMWRSELRGTISCMTTKGTDGERVNIETRRLEVVRAGEKQWMPEEWRAALWEYVQAWPESGCGYGPLLAITERERCDFLRKMAAELATADDIGCRLIAHGIGEFAAVEYELEVRAS